MKQVQQELGSGLHFQSMEKENAQYVDSIAGKLNKLKETWVSIFNTIFSSDATKGLLDGLISVSEAISKIVTGLDEVGMLTPMLTALGAGLTAKFMGNGIEKAFKGVLGSATGLSRVIPGLTGIMSKFGVASATTATATLATETAIAGAGTAGVAATGMLSSLTPILLGIAGATAVVGAGLWVFDHFNESLDEEKQRLNETISARKEEIASIDEQKGKLQEIQEEYDTLSNKPQKTAEEVSRLTELTKQLAEIRPDLVVGTDSNGNSILSMTGDVKDLIKEMDRASESKKKLLSVEQEDLAKNSIKQLHGSIQGFDPTTGIALNSDSEMYKLEQSTRDHISKMGSLEKERDKILNKLYDSTGKERQKILKDLEKANYNIEKEQSDFAQKYQQQLDVVKEYSDKIGEGIFASLENSSTFKGMDTELQGKFSNLKNSLDFSDIKTEDELLEVEMALSNLMKAAANGDINIDKISKSLEKANTEFAKTGDAEKYGQAIDKIISDLEKATGKDFSMLKDVFEGMDTSILKGKDALDEFLRAYGKTKSDLDNNDGFAKALANQKRQIEQAIEELNNVTGDAELDLELAYNIVNNNELPMQLRDMVRVLLNKGHNSTEVVKFAQELLVDISDGKINIEEANKKIEDKFGEGAFEITPEILLSDDTKIAGIERVIEQLTDKFGEVPPVVKTVIEAEGITAYSQARLVLETYNSIPEEVRTTMSTNGLETLSDIINVQNMLELLPTDVVMNIVSNFPDVISGAGNVQEIINSLPSSVLLEIQSNYPEVVEKSKLLQDAIDKIPASKESVVSVKEEVEKSPNGIFDRLFGKGRDTMTTTAVVNAQVNNLQALEETENIINRLTGGRSGVSNSSSSSGKGRSIDALSVEPLNDFSPMSRATKGGGSNSGTSSSGGGHSVTINVDVNGEEELQALQSTLDKFTIGDVKATITIHTALAAQNLSGLITRINQTKQAISTMQGKTINIVTALAAQNLSGLIVRVNQYKSAILSTTDKTINVHTAQAAKNISGLISKIQQCNNTKPKPITFTAYTAQAAKNISGLIRKINSVPTSKTIRFNISQSGSVPSGGESTFGLQPSGENIVRTYNVANEVVDATTITPNQISTLSDIPSVFNQTRATIKTPMALGGDDINKSIKYNIKLLTELENRVKAVSNQLSILDKKMKHATGEEKIKYLEEQNKLYQEQLQHQKELESALNKQQTHYKNFLSSKGFQFTSDGNLKNYEEKLIAMEKEAERLEEIASKDKASDSQKKASEDYKNNLEEIKKYLNEYIKVAYEDLPGVTEEFIDINNAIQDNINSIKEFEKEIAELKEDSKYKNENRDIWEVENKLDKNDALLETAVGKEEIKLLEERVYLYELLKKEKQDLLSLENETREGLMSNLAEYGFTFRDDGSIEHYGQKIENLKKTLTEDEFDNVYSMVEDYLDSTYQKIPELENEIIGIGDSIRDAQNKLDYAPVEDIDKEIERAEEEELLGLLKEKLELLQQVANKKQEYIDLLQQEADKTKGELEQSGIKFNDDGSIQNYEETIKSLQQSLKNATGDSAKEIEIILSKLESYVKATESDIPKAVEEWKDTQDQIKETGKEIDDIEKKQAKFLKDRAEAVRKATEDIMKVTQDLLQTQMNINKKHIDMIEKSMELSSFDPTKTFETLQKQIDLLEKQKELQSQMGQELEKQKSYYKDRLISFGITFDDKGIATNVEDILSKIKNQMANASDSDELDALEEKFNDIVGVLGDYNGALEDIVDNQSDLMDLQLEIEGVYENMLETTKKIEDKITSIIEKQVEERKKLIDEELKKRLDSINKQKEVYNKQREEDKYQKEYDDKLKELSDLQAKIDAVSKDTSMAGQAKLAELLEEFNKKQEEFDEMVQDQLDKEINEAFDKESDRLEEEAKKEKDKLDEILDKENLQEIIKDALNNGKLTNIDGSITDLKDALLEYEDKYGDGLSVIGGLIKKDLLNQLDISLDTMKNIEDILKNLNISDLYKSNVFSFDYPKFDTHAYSTVSNQTIHFNESLVTIQGNVTKDVMPDLEKQLREAERRITANIINATR